MLFTLTAVLVRLSRGEPPEFGTLEASTSEKGSQAAHVEGPDPSLHVTGGRQRCKDGWDLPNDVRSEPGVHRKPGKGRCAQVCTGKCRRRQVRRSAPFHHPCQTLHAFAIPSYVISTTAGCLLPLCSLHVGHQTSHSYHHTLVTTASSVT